LKEYAGMKRKVMPDLTLVLEEEVEAVAEDAPRFNQTTTHYEVDSGAGRGMSGGYTPKEILNKIQNGPQGMVWATPGGLSSTQGQKIHKLLTKTRTLSRVISI
jgi:hypothetical protein